MIPLTRTTALLAALLLPAGDDDPVDVDFATLADFEYEEGMELPDHVTELDGKRVTISGFMQSEDGTEGPCELFMLINDGCGCEGTPFLNEIVFCAMPEGETTELEPGIVKLVGTLWVGEEVEDDVVLSLYTMDVETVGK